MISYSKILPLLIIVAILAFSVRLTEVITGISNLSASAYAETKTEEEHEAEPAKNEEEPAMAEDEHEEVGGEGEEQEGTVEQVDDAEVPEWRDASDSNLDVASIKLEMFEDLSERRDRLEEAEQQLRVSRSSA